MDTFKVMVEMKWKTSYLRLVRGRGNFKIANGNNGVYPVIYWVIRQFFWAYPVVYGFIRKFMGLSGSLWVHPMVYWS